MNRKLNSSRISRYASLMRKHARSKCVFTPCAPLLRAGFCILIVCVGPAAVRAQTVIPSVCIEPDLQSGTFTLTQNAPAGQASITVTSPGAYPKNVRVIINPGGTTEETFLFAQQSASSSAFFSLRTINGGSASLANSHSAGETVQWSTDVKAKFGYNNTSSAALTITRGIISGNFFAPGALTYPEQITQFLPGIHSNAWSLAFPTRDGPSITWFLSGGSAKLGSDTPRCAVITYQGRLSDGSAAANGLYDLRFTPYDALTGGAAQNDSITVEDTIVRDGVFTVGLDFGSALLNNNNARFLEIAVRPGSATGSDPFTTLTPRQPITLVPYAVNAQTADTARKIPVVSGAPPAGECNESGEIGQIRFDTLNYKLYVCVAAGWKSTTLQ